MTKDSCLSSISFVFLTIRMIPSNFWLKWDTRTHWTDRFQSPIGMACIYSCCYIYCNECLTECASHDMIHSYASWLNRLLMKIYVRLWIYSLPMAQHVVNKLLIPNTLLKDREISRNFRLKHVLNLQWNNTN